MKITLSNGLNFLASVATRTGVCPVAAVLGSLVGLTGGQVDVPTAGSSVSSLAPTLMTALQLAQQHAANGGTDPLSVITSALSMGVPAAQPTLPPTDPATVKMLADRQQIADIKARIQTLLANFKR